MKITDNKKKDENGRNEELKRTKSNAETQEREEISKWKQSKSEIIQMKQREERPITRENRVKSEQI